MRRVILFKLGNFARGALNEFSGCGICNLSNFLPNFLKIEVEVKVSQPLHVLKCGYG